MGGNLQNVLTQALSLPEIDRVRVIESLQDSLHKDLAEVEQAWIPIALERAKQIDAGQASVGYPEVLRKYRESRDAA